MNLISSPRPTTGLPGLASTSTPAAATDAKTGPSFGELLDGQMAPTKAPDRTASTTNGAAAETPAVPGDVARNLAGAASPAPAAADDTAPAAAQLLDMLDLMQQVRSSGNSGGKPAPAAPVAALTGLAPSGPTTTAAATALPTRDATSPEPGLATRSVPVNVPVDAQALLMAAAQAPAASTKPATGDEAATDSEAPATIAAPPLDAVTMALLAAGQLQTAASRPPVPPQDAQADDMGSDASALTAAAKPAGDGKAAATVLAAQPGQLESARQAEETAALVAAAPTAPLKREKTDAEDIAATSFESRLTAQTERTPSAEPVAGPPASSSNIGTSLAPTGSAAHAAAPVQHQILTGFGNRGWDQAVSQRVLWLAQDQLQQASLTLNPPHLGPVQVTVQIDNQQAMVQFVSNQPEVRQALQDAMPVLREMFGQAGITLGQADVSSRNPDQGQARQSTGAEAGTGDEAELALDGLATLLPRAAGQGLINLFA